MIQPANQMTLAEFQAIQTGGKAPTRIQGGKDAQAGGKGFEADLENTHEWYRQQKIADIDKLPVNTAPMPRAWLHPKHSMKGGICRLLSERQRADYFGTLKGGRAVVMEAKANGEAAKSLPILRPDQKGFGLKAHQLAGLVESHRFGALACLLWRNGPNRLVFPADVLTAAWEEFRLGRLKRLQGEQAIEYPLSRYGVVSVHDWLSVLIAR